MEGVAAEAGTSAEWHRLSAVNVDDRTAICSVCGPTRIRVRNGGRGSECWTKSMQNRGRPDRPSRLTPGWSRAGRPVPTPASRAKHRYGLATGEFEALMEAADGICDLCGLHAADGLQIDHDHGCCPGRKACGRCIRGVLCGSCNRGLAFFADDPIRLSAAIDYLSRTRKTPRDEAPRSGRSSRGGLTG